MYKISINDHSFCLVKSEEVEDFRMHGYELYPYMGQKSSLQAAIDKLEQSAKTLKLGFYAADFHQLKSDFKSLFKIIKAMGGIVTRPSGEILVIYRQDKWDLPKGKKEKKESKKECAVREVKEETGLRQLDLNNKVGKTRHIYRHPRTGARVLKITYWYEMKTEEPDHLILQQEEDIVDSKWVSLEDFLHGNYSTFVNIIDILRKYQEINRKRNLKNTIG